MRKEYFQIYYKDHKEEYKKVYKSRRVLGVRLKEKELKPFMERISPELRAKIEENTKVNNKEIKFFTRVETKDSYLVQNLMKMKETKAEN